MESSDISSNNLCAVLIIDGITYGRLNNKLLYKCIPDDKTMPHLLVPYDDKSMYFSKAKTNKYVMVNTVPSPSPTTTPTTSGIVQTGTGSLTSVFGEVDDLEAYIEYQMACKKLGSSIKPLNIATMRALREKPLTDLLKQHYLLEDRLSWPIISIDPLGCQDIDDAIGLRRMPDGQTVLSIYISNVPFILDYLNLWSFVSDRISTLYFSHKKVPMMSRSLSEYRCSLLQAEERVVFALDVYIYAGLIKKVEIVNALIKVEKNYEYEADELLKRSDYKDMLKLVKHLNQESIKYLAYVDEVKDSHDFVEFCMILMNHECAKLLKAKKKGIFRSALKKEAQSPEDEDYKKVVIDAPELTFLLQGVAGEYCLFDNMKPHELIGKGLQCYVHITSPIRRIVDIINMMELQMGTTITSKSAEDFLKKWTSPEAIGTINKKTKAIRRLQNDVMLLQLYEKNNVQVYMGIILGAAPASKARGQGVAAPSVPYRVFVPDIKLLTTIYSDKILKTYSLVECTVHLFLDESNMSKKVRLQLL